MGTDSRDDVLFGRKAVVNYYHYRALQVRRYKGIISAYIHLLFSPKRASLRLPVTCKASVSVEASVALPIFLFCFLEILSLFNYLSVYSMMLYNMKTVAEPAAVYASETEDITASYLCMQLLGKCRNTLCEKIIKNGSLGISFLGSSVDYTAAEVDLLAHYTVKPLISFAGTELKLTNRYYTRLWTGAGKNSEGVGEIYVYVAQNGTVYHLQEDCAYLKLSISTVQASEIEKVRNSVGAVYAACTKCCNEGNKAAAYYVTKYGERYHESIICSGLKRTIYCFKKEEAGNLPPCSKCGKAGL